MADCYNHLCKIPHLYLNLAAFCLEAGRNIHPQMVQTINLLISFALEYSVVLHQYACFHICCYRLFTYSSNRYAYIYLLIFKAEGAGIENFCAKYVWSQIVSKQLSQFLKQCFWWDSKSFVKAINRLRGRPINMYSMLGLTQNIKLREGAK